MNKTQRGHLETIARKAKRPVADVIEIWEERAAIREYDAGMNRRQAESEAMIDVAMEVLRA